MHVPGRRERRMEGDRDRVNTCGHLEGGHVATIVLTHAVRFQGVESRLVGEMM